MNKFFIGVFLVLFSITVAIPQATFASTLTCSQVDGMAIFGYDYNEWKFIGAISNEYDSNSIANEYGAGNEYSSDSIFNDYGTYGGEYSSYSAFNEYTTSAPIIVDDNYNFIGYLTVNEYNIPNINTYEAIACAKKSYSSSSSKMEDITFKKIPTSGTYSGTSYPSSLPTSCPSNSSLKGSSCVCNSGYVTDSTKTYCVIQPPTTISCTANASSVGGICTCNAGYFANGNTCISGTQNCQNTYGANSYSNGDQKYCYCSDGYQWNATKTACTAVPSCPSGYTMNANGSCVPTPQMVAPVQPSYSPPKPSPSDPIELCVQKLGRYGVVAGQSSCGCADGYTLNNDKNYCVAVVTTTPITSAPKTPEVPTQNQTPVTPTKKESTKIDSKTTQIKPLLKPVKVSAATTTTDLATTTTLSTDKTLPPPQPKTFWSKFIGLFKFW